MSMVIKVQWEDGRPCQGTRVTAWIDGQGNDEAYTNYNGEAFFYLWARLWNDIL